MASTVSTTSSMTVYSAVLTVATGNPHHHHHHHHHHGGDSSSRMSEGSTLYDCTTAACRDTLALSVTLLSSASGGVRGTDWGSLTNREQLREAATEIGGWFRSKMKSNFSQYEKQNQNQSEGCPPSLQVIVLLTVPREALRASATQEGNPDVVISLSSIGGAAGAEEASLSEDLVDAIFHGGAAARGTRTEEGAEPAAPAPAGEGEISLLILWDPATGDPMLSVPHKEPKEHRLRQIFTPWLETMTIPSSSRSSRPPQVSILCPVRPSGKVPKPQRKKTSGQDTDSEDSEDSESSDDDEEEKQNVFSARFPRFHGVLLECLRQVLLTSTVPSASSLSVPVNETPSSASSSPVRPGAVDPSLLLSLPLNVVLSSPFKEKVDAALREAYFFHMELNPKVAPTFSELYWITNATAPVTPLPQRRGHEVAQPVVVDSFAFADCATARQSTNTNTTAPPAVGPQRQQGAEFESNGVTYSLCPCLSVSSAIVRARRLGFAAESCFMREATTTTPPPTATSSPPAAAPVVSDSPQRSSPNGTTAAAAAAAIPLPRQPPSSAEVSSQGDESHQQPQPQHQHQRPSDDSQVMRKAETTVFDSSRSKDPVQEGRQRAGSLLTAPTTTTTAESRRLRPEAQVFKPGATGAAAAPPVPPPGGGLGLSFVPGAVPGGSFFGGSFFIPQRSGSSLVSSASSYLFENPSSSSSASVLSNPLQANPAAAGAPNAPPFFLGSPSPPPPTVAGASGNLTTATKQPIPSGGGGVASAPPIASWASSAAPFPHPPTYSPPPSPQALAAVPAAQQQQQQQQTHAAPAAASTAVDSTQHDPSVDPRLMIEALCAEPSGEADHIGSKVKKNQKRESRSPLALDEDRQPKVFVARAGDTCNTLARKAFCTPEQLRLFHNEYCSRPVTFPAGENGIFIIDTVTCPLGNKPVYFPFFEHESLAGSNTNSSRTVTFLDIAQRYHLVPSSESHKGTGTGGVGGGGGEPVSLEELSDLRCRFEQMNDVQLPPQLFAGGARTSHRKGGGPRGAEDDYRRPATTPVEGGPVYIPLRIPGGSVRSATTSPPPPPSTTDGTSSIGFAVTGVGVGGPGVALVATSSGKPIYPGTNEHASEVLGYNVPDSDEGVLTIADIGAQKKVGGAETQRWCVVCFTEVSGVRNWQHHVSGARHRKRLENQRIAAATAREKEEEPLAVTTTAEPFQSHTTAEANLEVLTVGVGVPPTATAAAPTSTAGGRSVIVPLGRHFQPVDDAEGNKVCPLCGPEFFRWSGPSYPKEQWLDHIASRDHLDRVQSDAHQVTSAMQAQFLCIPCRTIISGNGNVELHRTGNRHKHRIANLNKESAFAASESCSAIASGPAPQAYQPQPQIPRYQPQADTDTTVATARASSTSTPPPPTVSAGSASGITSTTATTTTGTSASGSSGGIATVSSTLDWKLFQLTVNDIETHL